MCAKNCFFLFIFITVFLFSCGRKTSEKPDAETYARYLKSGNEISTQAQAALLTNVSRAMEQGGSLFAVEFCNLEASSIVDSLNNLYNCNIARVSDKNRNPENRLQTGADKQLWTYFFNRHQQGLVHDTLIQDGDRLVYYKPILTAMPACLQCHGPASEINPGTLEKIQTLYPGDLATGYGMNELRGLWKIGFGKN